MFMRIVHTKLCSQKSTKCVTYVPVLTSRTLFTYLKSLFLYKVRVAACKEITITPTLFLV